MKYLFNDPNGTATLSMDTTTQQVARQQNTPYGQPRPSANTTTWPDPTHSYLGKPQDTTTGYTDVGARKYDPTLGRFISADPVFDATSPQQLGGYTYAGDNPVANSDPTGLWLDDGTGHNEPRSDGPSGPASPTPGIPAGGTGPGGCYYTCGSGSTTSNTSDTSANSNDCWPLSACSSPSYSLDVGDTSKSPKVTPVAKRIIKALKEYWKYLNKGTCTEDQKRLQLACSPMGGSFQIGPLGEGGGAPEGKINDAQNMLTDLQAAADGGKTAVVARLDIPGRDPIYGVNGHGQAYPRPASVMPQSMGHAESDTFIQAANAGVSGGTADLYVAGKIPCGFCRSSLGGWAKHLDLDKLNVYGPNGYVGQYVKGGRYRTLEWGDNPH